MTLVNARGDPTERCQRWSDLYSNLNTLPWRRVVRALTAGCSGGYCSGQVVEDVMSWRNMSSWRRCSVRYSDGLGWVGICQRNRSPSDLVHMR
jgi:hypothetical protein